MKRLNITFDPALIDSIATDFDLRSPNREALRKLVSTLDGEYDPSVMQVLNLATGVGKTYLMAAFVEYLRRQGCGNVVIVTPGKTVQSKTIQNFMPGSPRYIRGADIAPEVVTPQDYSAWVARQNGAAQLSYGRAIPMLAFVFNIQQLIAPKNVEGKTHDGSAGAGQRRPRRFDENAGVLFDYLSSLDDLVVIADESHLYSVSAAAFRSALEELDPAACIGLTASKGEKDHVIFEYPLYKAIADRYVKAPVLAFRREGYGADQASEEQQLRDALQLRQFKQRHYDAFTQAHGLPYVNAVVFVVCSDVEHATQVADLLRSPGYLGRESAVLQVDSKHDDEATQRLLDRLDAADSPVKAVVSVNMLKEGWDVKNIAVVVTLRAMASEVLTQQTMGRGLRLPFGRYTDIAQIDQLDIISHQSFRDLLENESVLRQFGLEEAAQDGKIEEAEEAIRRIVRKTHERHESGKASSSSAPASGGGVLGGAAMPPSSSGMVRPASTPAADPRHTGSSQIPSTVPGQPGLRIRTIANQVGQDPVFTADHVEFEVVERSPKFLSVSYLFPTTTIETSAPQILLSDVSPREITNAAKRVTDTGDILIRKEIITALNRGKKQMSTRDAEKAEVASRAVSRDKVEEVLLRLVMANQSIARTVANDMYARSYIVRNFLRDAPLGEGEWTVKALSSASHELDVLLRSFVATKLRERTTSTEIHPRKLPSDSGVTLPLGERIHEIVDSQQSFRTHAYYGPWDKCLFTAESFDSYSGEYQLARLLDIDPHIQWWHRLHLHDNAYLYYTSKDRYFPDFVALDDYGTYWIIEGKSDAGRRDGNVQAKRRAAEELVIRLLGEPEFVAQHWGYLVAYEGDIAASDSWNDLKSKAQPVTNA